MNKEWSELNKAMQLQLKKADTFSDGINTLINLRKNLMDVIEQFRNELSDDNFSAMPYINAKGYHSKSIAYSLWHIFRIEDIVVNTLIAEKEQVFFRENYQERTNSPIITTGNELTAEEIRAFSERLNINGLHEYISDTDKATTELIKRLSYSDMKAKIKAENRQLLENLGVVSNNENAVWLIDYWCSKDIRGLIQMPLSRHWIMHIEACLRIHNKLK